MDISVNEINSGTHIKIFGSVKQNDINTLSASFEEILTTSKNNVSIDLGFVAAMSSLGIGKLIYFNNELKSQNRTLTIIDISKSLHSLFNSMNLNQVFGVKIKND